MNSLWAKAAQHLAFARHIPPRKILRRLELTARRKLAQLSPPSLAVAATPRQDPPLPLFTPRSSSARKDGDAWRFTFLGREIDAGPGPDWRTPQSGPSQQLWRMNLHYMEYLESVDDGAFEQLIISWLAANPPFSQSAWRDSWNTYAAALRAIVWMQQLAARSSRLPAPFYDRCVKSIAQHIAYIQAFIETDIGGNHLIKNIKALIWASCFFEGASARRWRALGVALLRAELAGQILPDGVHDERSPSYHAQVFADLLEIRWALSADPLDGALDATLALMAQATADLAHPDGGPALFNDSGLAMAYRPSECLDAYARLFRRRPAPRNLFGFTDAGYFGLRAADFYLLADCGPIAPDDLPAHGHGDILSFELSFKGARFIVDQGVYEYEAGDRRQRARAAASHNTLVIDGADQADFFAAFRMGRRAKARVREWTPQSNSFVLEGGHDGYAHLPGRPRHVRRFNARAHALDIEDRIEGDCPYPATAALLLHPDVKVSSREGGATLSRDGANLDLACSAPLAVELAVWWPDMGVELPTKRLRVRLAPPERTISWRFAPTTKHG